MPYNLEYGNTVKPESLQVVESKKHSSVSKNQLNSEGQSDGPTVETKKHALTTLSMNDSKSITLISETSLESARLISLIELLPR